MLIHASPEANRDHWFSISQPDLLTAGKSSFTIGLISMMKVWHGTWVRGLRKRTSQLPGSSNDLFFWNDLNQQITTFFTFHTSKFIALNWSSPNVVQASFFFGFSLVVLHEWLSLANRAVVNNRACLLLSDWEGQGGFKSTAAPPNLSRPCLWTCSWALT